MKNNKFYLILLIISLIVNMVMITQLFANKNNEQINSSMKQLGFKIGFYVKTIEEPNSEILMINTIDNLIIIANENIDSELSKSILSEMDLVKDILTSNHFLQETNQQQRDAVADLINTKFEESNLHNLTSDIETYLKAEENE